MVQVGPLETSHSPARTSDGRLYPTCYRFVYTGMAGIVPDSHSWTLRLIAGHVHADTYPWTNASVHTFAQPHAHPWYLHTAYSLIVFYTHAHGMHAFKILQPETLLPFSYCFIGFHFPAVSAHVVSAKYTRIWTDRHSIDICLHPYSCFSCVIWVVPIKYICKNVRFG